MTMLGIGWLEILSWYMAAGVILYSVTYIKKRLADAASDKDEDSDGWLILPALTPRERLLRFLEPIIAFPVCVAIWPIAVLWMVEGKRFSERLPEPVEFKVTREHLREVLPVGSIEADRRVFDPLGAVPDLPFGHLNPAWEKLKAGMQPGDEVSTFLAPWKSYGVMWELSGFAIVRAGESVNFWVMGQKIANAQAAQVTASLGK